MEKKIKRESWQASLVRKTADLTGLSTRQVRRVINGDCDNQLVMSTYMTLWEGENTLLETVKNTLAEMV